MYGRVTPWGFPVVAECSGEAEDSGGGFFIAFDFARAVRRIRVEAESPRHAGVPDFHRNRRADRAPRIASVASLKTAQRSRSLAPSAGADDDELARIRGRDEFARKNLAGEGEDEKKQEAHRRE